MGVNNLKFRAWHKEDKRMLVVDRLFFDGEGEISCVGLVRPRDINLLVLDLNEIELMQWTGTKDLLGNEIFEGDILAHDHGGGVESFTIEPNPDDNQLHARYLYMLGDNTDYLGEAPLQGSIIIGNIYENSELLAT